MVEEEAGEVSEDTDEAAEVDSETEDVIVEDDQSV